MGRATAIFTLAFALPAAIGFLTFSYLTHTLSPYEYGLYSTTVSFAYFAGSALYAWVRFSIARYEAEQLGGPALGFWLRCFGAMLPVGALVMAMMWGTGLVSLPIAIAVFVLSACQNLYDISLEMRRARRQPVPFLVYSLLRSLLSIALAVALASRFQSGALLLFSLAAAFLIAGMTNVVRLLRESQGSIPRSYDVRQVASYGIAIAFSSLVFSSLGVISRLAVAQMVGLSASGPFNAAMDLAGQISGVVSMSVAAVITPPIFKANGEGDRATIIRQMRSGVELLLALTVPTTVGLILVSSTLAQVVTGPLFQSDVAALLPWLALSLTVWSIDHYYLHIVFQMSSRPANQVALGALHIAVLAILTFVLIRQYGAVGAAQATFFANLIVFVATAVLARRLFPVPLPVIALAKVAVATAFMTAAVILVADVVVSPAASLAAQSCAGGFAYAAAAIVLNLCGSRSALMARLRTATRR